VPWFLKSGLSGSEKRVALELIRHLQTMYAYQQFAMERVNDAGAVAAGTGTPTDEGLVRPQMLLWQPRAVAEYVLPALQTKLETLALMDKQHRAFFCEPGVGPIRLAYDDFTSLLAIMRERATLQYEGFNAWSKDPSLETDVSGLDSAESAALNKSVASLNDLIAKAGLRVNEEPWLELNCEAFNAVRGSVGLPPLSGPDFRRRYFGGMAGRPARFFRD
jgi:hypothetical protein